MLSLSLITQSRSVSKRFCGRMMLDIRVRCEYIRRSFVMFHFHSTYMDHKFNRMHNKKVALSEINMILTYDLKMSLNITNTKHYKRGCFLLQYTSSMILRRESYSMKMDIRGYLLSISKSSTFCALKPKEKNN